MLRNALYSGVSRRVFLTTLMAGGLAACSDSGSTDETASAETPDAAPDKTTTNAVLRDPAATVSTEKLMEAGALPEKTLGDASAPVTIVEYASMTCGHCAAFHNDTFKTIKENYIDTGKVYFILREFPFDPIAEAAFMLTRCAGDNYFPMVDALFASQQTWARAEKPSEALFQISKQAGFTQESFNACLTDSELLENIRAVRTKGADEFDVDSTPTFFINGKRFPGNMSVPDMSALIDAEM